MCMSGAAARARGRAAARTCRRASMAAAASSCAASSASSGDGSSGGGGGAPSSSSCQDDAAFFCKSDSSLEQIANTVAGHWCSLDKGRGAPAPATGAQHACCPAWAPGGNWGSSVSHHAHDGPVSQGQHTPHLSSMRGAATCMLFLTPDTGLKNMVEECRDIGHAPAWRQGAGATRASAPARPAGSAAAGACACCAGASPPAWSAGAGRACSAGNKAPHQRNSSQHPER